MQPALLKKFLRVPVRAAAALRAWRAEGGGRFVRSVYGPYLLDTPGDFTFELCRTGYGPFVPGVIAKLDREFVFLDIGANLGLFSILADRHPLCRGVFAFEPLPRIFANLNANLARNGAKKVTATCAAISDRGHREVLMSFDPRHSGMSKVLQKAEKGAIRAKALDAVDLAALVPTGPASIVAKIDVEGSELAVVSVLRRTPLYSVLSDIVIEISDRNLDAQTKQRLLELLESDGFAEIDRSGPAEHYDAHYRRLACLAAHGSPGQSGVNRAALRMSR